MVEILCVEEGLGKYSSGLENEARRFSTRTTTLFQT